MLVAHASETRSPFKPRRTASAAWSRSNRSAVNRNVPSSPRSMPCPSEGWTLGPGSLTRHRARKNQHRSVTNRRSGTAAGLLVTELPQVHDALDDLMTDRLECAVL